MASTVFTPSAGDAIAHAADVALRSRVLRRRTALGATTSLAGTPLPALATGTTCPTG